MITFYQHRSFLETINRYPRRFFGPWSVSDTFFESTETKLEQTQLNRKAEGNKQEYSNRIDSD